MKYLVIILSLFFFGIGYIMSIIPVEQFIEIFSIIAVIMISLPSLYGMHQIYGRRGITVIFALGTFAIIIETIGVHTGFPYSSFQYIMPFGYKLFDTTPWTVFFAWSPLVIGAFVLSHYWFKQWWSQLLIYLGLLVGTDIILDPGAVARGLWQYTNGGIWYGVPLENFGGWVFSGLIACGIFYFILKPVISNINATSSKNLIITSLSLILSLSLWIGVNLGYELWLPFFTGIILISVVIFIVIKKPAF